LQGGAYSGFTVNVKAFLWRPKFITGCWTRKSFPWTRLPALAFGVWTTASAGFPACCQEFPSDKHRPGQIPLFGARFRVNLAKGWYANLIGDAGGFGAGSQLTWQVFTGLGKEFKQRYSVLLGYRYLDVDYKNGGFLFDTHMSGLLAGFGIRFK
jgi:hypothetical protein